MGRYDYDDMPSEQRGRRGRGSRRTALVSLICILILLIGIVIYLIAVPAEVSSPTAEVNVSSTEASIVPEEFEVTTSEPEFGGEVTEPETELFVESNEEEASEVSVPEMETTEEVVPPMTVEEEMAVPEVPEEIQMEREGAVEAFAEEVTDTSMTEEAPEVPSIEEESIHMESNAPVVPVITAEEIQKGFLSILGQMNMAPISNEEETAEDVVAIEETVPVGEIAVEEAVVETIVEEPAVEELVFKTAHLEPKTMVSDGIDETVDDTLSIQGKAGQAVKSPIAGVVTKVGKDNGERTIVIETEEGYSYVFAGFERVGVKSGQSIGEGTVLGSLGKSSKTPMTIRITILDENGEKIHLD